MPTARLDKVPEEQGTRTRSNEIPPGSHGLLIVRGAGRCQMQLGKVCALDDIEGWKLHFYDSPVPAAKTK